VFERGEEVFKDIGSCEYRERFITYMELCTLVMIELQRRGKDRKMRRNRLSGKEQHRKNNGALICERKRERVP
jgi:hypothetical protein